MACWVVGTGKDSDWEMPTNRSGDSSVAGGRVEAHLPLPVRPLPPDRKCGGRKLSARTFCV